MSDSYDHVKIRTAKSWQGKQPIYVFQSSFSGIKSADNPIKKFFVVIDSRQDVFGVRLTVDKPESLVPQGGMVNQMRKHCKGATIGDILKDDSNGNLWIVLYSQGQEWFLRLAKSRPPEMALVNPDGEMVMRMGMKGTFTKKKPLEDQVPGLNPSLISIKNEMIADFLKQFDEEVEENSEDDDDLDEEENDLSKEQRVLLQKLKRKLKTYRKAAEKQLGKIPEPKDIENMDKHAHLLQSFAYLVKDGDFQLELPKELSGQTEDIVIELDTEKSVGANIENFFVGAKKARKSREMGLKVAESNRKDLEQLESDLKMLQEPLPLSEVELLFDKYKLPRVQASNTQAKAAAVAKPYRVFKSSSGHDILVGKGPRENDELTKSAKTNDYWIHTSAVAGSHIVVPAAKDIRQALPSQLLREAAILAVHYSKLRSDMAGEVYVARRSEIKKQKGMPPGLWNVERCKTLFFRYSQEDLKQVLDRLQSQ
ncbi:NFACT RNA binding domain-containing protein [Pseudobacteriovorax antillogorgiicola]|uniref:Fibronectin-binding protein A N-terminus (FbpA) n=1 Tax=Pseudobacteriovorax antillogorgiicola TaxID=1513793 RepID=A0A1Y6CJH8_9BACT|nr:NFACT RNA binding domain-containing protein [Pseudobacteriovorax antillogorgiicola]TCS48580.1 fibronectin-binding protein A (FbpA) [Pseudobacteriovorax antillogorgiicola]SMF55697.1 Fibronectin-binding protein A N-terminus (FbpA) [Pseudobacteriovorax antillogorgiicola]